MDEALKDFYFPAQISRLDICHNCIHGGDMVMKCNCPELQGRKDWLKITYPTYYRAQIARRIHAIAEVRHQPTFSATPYLAVMEAVGTGECKFFKAIR